MNREHADLIAEKVLAEVVGRAPAGWLRLVEANEQWFVVGVDGVTYEVAVEAWQEYKHPERMEILVVVTDGSLASGLAPVVRRQEVIATA